MSENCPVCNGVGYVVIGTPPEGFADNSAAVQCVMCAGMPPKGCERCKEEQ